MLIAVGPTDDPATQAQALAAVPCRNENPDLWFAERPEQLGQAQRLCAGCPIRQQCLAAALARKEPWGVWGGEIFERGQVIPFKRGRGRPAKARPVAAGLREPRPA